MFRQSVMRPVFALMVLAVLLVAAKQSPVYDTTASCNEGQVLKLQSGFWGCANESGGSLPAGIIVFTAGACPATWTEYTAAQGFAVVGLPSGGTNAGTVGTALTNLQDKTHAHTYTQVVNHVHGLTTVLRTATTGSATTQVTDAQDTSSTADATRKTDNPDGGVATGTTATKATSDVIPYIQLRACSKD